MNTEKLVLLLRHGHVLRPEKHYPRDSEVHLSPVGLAQITRVAVALETFLPHRLISSPFARAMETAAIIAERVRLPVQLDHRFRERAFRCFYDKSAAEIAAQYSREILAQLISEPDSLDLPGEESLEDCQVRVVSGIQEWLRGTETRFVIVGHGGPHGWLCAYYLGVPLISARLFQLDYGCFSVFRFSETGQFLTIAPRNVQAFAPLFCV